MDKSLVAEAYNLYSGLNDKMWTSINKDEFYRIERIASLALKRYTRRYNQWQLQHTAGQDKQ